MFLKISHRKTVQKFQVQNGGTNFPSWGWEKMGNRNSSIILWGTKIAHLHCGVIVALGLVLKLDDRNGTGDTFE